MARRLISVGVVTFGLVSAAWVPLAAAQPVPSPTPVPTAKRVVTTPGPAPRPAAPPGPAAPTPGPALPPPAATPATAPAPSSVEKARQGVVVIERQGKPNERFAVELDEALAGGGFYDLAKSNARLKRGAVYTRADLKLVHSDRGWDLALLGPVPKPGQAPNKTGLRAARTPSFVGLQSFVRSGAGAISVVPTTLKLSPGLLGGDGKALGSAYELGTKPALLGAPIVNAEGEVVALVARACPASGKPPCVPIAYGAPVTALKQFLQRVPAEATWLGLEVAADETSSVRGVRVVSVSPQGRAAAVGIRPGKDAMQADLILAVDGTPVASPAELNSALRARASGDAVELLLFGLGRYRSVTVRPRPAPAGPAPMP